MPPSYCIDYTLYGKDTRRCIFKAVELPAVSTSVLKIRLLVSPSEAALFLSCAVGGRRRRACEPCSRRLPQRCTGVSVVGVRAFHRVPRTRRASHRCPLSYVRAQARPRSRAPATSRAARRVTVRCNPLYWGTCIHKYPLHRHPFAFLSFFFL